MHDVVWSAGSCSAAAAAAVGQQAAAEGSEVFSRCAGEDIVTGGGSSVELRKALDDVLHEARAVVDVRL